MGLVSVIVTAQISWSSELGGARERERDGGADFYFVLVQRSKGEMSVAKGKKIQCCSSCSSFGVDFVVTCCSA